MTCLLTIPATFNAPPAGDRPAGDAFDAADK